MPVVEKESFWAAKGLHLGSKRSPFGGQKGYIWRAKGVLLENYCFYIRKRRNFMGLGGITAQATAGTP